MAYQDFIKVGKYYRFAQKVLSFFSESLLVLYLVNYQ